MKPSDNPQYLLFGGTFVLANKLQFVGDKLVEGLSTKQWFLLRNIIDLPGDPPPTITDIAKAMDSTRQNIAKMLAPLEREGFVTVGKNERDLRRREVRLTDKGSAYLKQMAENAKDFFERLYDGVDPGELDTAGKVLKEMMNNLLRMQESLEGKENEPYRYL